MPTVIVVDAMGSDRAPKPEVEGAVLAARHHDVRVLLVGKEGLVRPELEHHPSAEGLPIEVVHASEVVGMHEKAAQAMRATPHCGWACGWCAKAALPDL
jgi:glycerol-3-phosphate acyltransferase PlsX